jgi:hypothetical protein
MADKELQHVRGGHEEKDVNYIAITKFGIGLAITVVVAAFLLLGLFDYFRSSEKKLYGAGPQLGAETLNPAKEPPQPRLQQSPPIDLREMRGAEDQLLHHYSWADRDKGIVRVPIDRAMDLLVQRGLPARAEVGQAVSPANRPQTGIAPNKQAEAPAPPTQGIKK